MPDTVNLPGGTRQLDLGDLQTEAVRPELGDLDLLGTADLVAVLSAGSRRAFEAVSSAAASIATAVDAAYQRLAAGGRLIYVGAGTSGRLAVLDAAELGPTFSVPEGTVEAIIAGGDDALRHAAEGAEDDPSAGAAAVRLLDVGPGDVVIGVSASGRTPYVLGAVQDARSAGAATIGITCNEMTPLSASADIAVELVVGGEVVAGSSRLNAGTAQKIALNTISTATMVRLGKTYGNLMVDLRATNTKLRDRAVRIVRIVTGVDHDSAVAALQSTDWDTKLACLMASSGKDLATVAPALQGARGRLREALVLVELAQHAAEQAPGTGTGATAPVPHLLRGPARAWERLGVGAAFVDGIMVPGDVAIDQGVIVAVGLAGTGPLIAVPGFVDLQVNGYAGVDAASATAAELEAMAVALARDGVLAYQPTLISGDPDVTVAALRRITTAAQATAVSGAGVLGAHLEGPFLSPERAGAHPADRLRLPDGELLRRLLAGGGVTMMTLAPELPGALQLIGALTQSGIVVSLGHSAASARQAAEAVTAGASAVTHLFNAMEPVSARAPGLAGFALSDPRARLQLVADGKHVADELLRVAFAAAPGRCSIVTDSTSLTRCPEGRQSLGEVPIEMLDGVALRPDGTIAGGTTTLLDAFRHLCSLDLSLAEALAAVTERPAKLLGRTDVGHLSPGLPANLLVLDDRLDMIDVVIGGRHAEGA